MKTLRQWCEDSNETAYQHLHTTRRIHRPIDKSKEESLMQLSDYEVSEIAVGYYVLKQRGCGGMKD